MGYQKHDVAVAIAWDTTTLFENEVGRINEVWMTPSADQPFAGRFPLIVASGPHVNGYRTWLFAYDGSKEGWTESDFVDTLRDEFVRAAQDYLPYASIAVCTVGSDDDEYSISCKENWREKEDE